MTDTQKKELDQVETKDSDWHYAIVGKDLGVYRFQTDEDILNFLNYHETHAFRFFDIYLLDGLKTCDWKVETDKLSGVTYEYTRVRLVLG